MRTILHAQNISNEVLNALENIEAKDIKELVFKLDKGQVINIHVKDHLPNSNKYQRIKELLTLPFQEIVIKSSDNKLTYVERKTKIKIG